MVPCKSTAEEVSFEWSHHRISPTDSKVRTTLHVSIIDSGSEMVKDKTVTWTVQLSRDRRDRNSYKLYIYNADTFCSADTKPASQSYQRGSMYVLPLKVKVTSV